MVDNKELLADDFPTLEELDEKAEEEYDGDASTGGRTLNEVERSGGNISDFKSAMKTLFPDWTDDEIDELEGIKKAMMVSNITYDSVIPLMQLTINHIIRRHSRDGIDNDKKPINPMTTYLKCHGIFFPAVQGRRTIDLLELYGSSGETSEATKEAASRFGV